MSNMANKNVRIGDKKRTIITEVSQAKGKREISKNA